MKHVPVTTACVALLLACGVARAQTDRYVERGGQTPAPRHISWATAAGNIQDAVGAASAGDTVLLIR